MSITSRVFSVIERGFFRSFAVALIGVVCFASCTNKEDGVLVNSHGDARPEQVEKASPDKIDWSDFSTQRLETTIASERCAIIYIGFPFSIVTSNSFAKILGLPFEDTDYYRFDADWSNRSDSPFYSDFGVPKDGSIVVQLPNGSKRIFKASSSLREDVLKFMESRKNVFQ